MKGENGCEMNNGKGRHVEAAEDEGNMKEKWQVMRTAGEKKGLSGWKYERQQEPIGVENEWRSVWAKTLSVCHVQHIHFHQFSFFLPFVSPPYKTSTSSPPCLFLIFLTVKDDSNCVESSPTFRPQTLTIQSRNSFCISNRLKYDVEYWCFGSIKQLFLPVFNAFCMCRYTARRCVCAAAGSVIDSEKNSCNGFPLQGAVRFAFQMKFCNFLKRNLSQK